MSDAPCSCAADGPFIEPRSQARETGIQLAFVQFLASSPRRVQLLSSGRYSVILTNAGGGFSRWRDLAITRWREDPTCDDWGSYVVLRDLEGGAPWSPTRQPLGSGSLPPEAGFDAGHASFRSSRDMLDATLQVAVSEECDGEVRRITLHNRSARPRTIELTSYAELVLGPAAADASHPAFSKMFVQTHWDAGSQVLLATRRKRTPADSDAWAAHFIVKSDGSKDDRVSYETDRARFLGRGHRLHDAAALCPGTALSNTAGTVLDPVFSLRTSVHLAAGATTRVDFWTLVERGRQSALDAAQTVRCTEAATRAIASTLAHAQTRHAGGQGDAGAGSLLAPLLYADAAWRADPETLRRGAGGAPILWSQGISGDRPIVLLHAADAQAGTAAAAALLRAQRHWRQAWLGIDVVLLAEATDDDGSLIASLATLVEDHADAIKADGDGARAEAFALDAKDLDEGFRNGLSTAARVVLEADGSGWKRVRGEDPTQPQPRARPPRAHPPQAHPPRANGAVMVDQQLDEERAAPGAEGQAIEFNNGYGGFVDAGRSYRIALGEGERTPMPWSNIVSSPCFGFLATAEGGGYTWSCNSQQNPLTPWRNDPVTDAPGEVLYLRDEDSGALWSATAAPIRVHATRYEVVHGKGWTRHAHQAHGIDVELLQYVPVDDSIKLSRLRLRNLTDRVRNLSVTGYVQWALAPHGTNASPFVVTDRDPSTGALFARNPWRAEFNERVAFIDLGGLQASCTADREEFLGRFGTIQAPDALSGQPLSGRVGAGLDPCGALQARLALQPGQQVELVFALGDAASAEQARALVQRYRRIPPEAVLDSASALWDDISIPSRSNAGSCSGHHAQRLAALPGAGLPPLGTQCVLPVQRRLRVPRPAAGRDGVVRGAPGPGT